MIIRFTIWLSEFNSNVNLLKNTVFKAHVRVSTKLYSMQENSLMVGLIRLVENLHCGHKKVFWFRAGTGTMLLLVFCVFFSSFPGIGQISTGFIENLYTHHWFYDAVYMTAWTWVLLHLDSILIKKKPNILNN